MDQYDVFNDLMGVLAYCIKDAEIDIGLKITDFDDENKIIIFEKNIQNRSRVILPDFLFNRTIPKSAKVEIEEFFREIQEKYRL